MIIRLYLDLIVTPFFVIRFFVIQLTKIIKIMLKCKSNEITAFYRKNTLQIATDELSLGNGNGKYL